MDEEGRRCSERNNVGQRIKFAAERTLPAAHAGNATFEQIENTGEKNEKQCLPDVAVTLREVRFDNFCERNETAEEIPGGHQVWQKIDFDARIRLRSRRLLLRFPDHNHRLTIAITFCATLYLTLHNLNIASEPATDQAYRRE